MKEGSKEKKSILFYVGIALVGALAVFMLALLLYCYWKGKIDDENGYNSINAIIAGFGLLVNFGTIIFVYRTFKLQNKQIDDNKKDVEFNRALDIVYKQLDHSKEKLKFSKYKTLLENLPYDNVDEWFNKITEIHNVINILKYETDFYIKLLSKSYLKDEDVEYLFKIYTSNLQVEVKRLFDCSKRFVNSFNVNLETRFEEYYDNNIRSEDNVYEYDNMTELLSILRTVVGKVNDIDTIFDKYNVY